MKLILARDKFFIQKITVPVCKPEELKNLLGYEVEKYFFVPKEDLVWDYHIFNDEVFLIVIKKEIIKPYFDKNHVQKITFKSFAFQETLQNQNCVILYLFDESVEINVYENNKLILSRVVKASNLENEYLLTLKSLPNFKLEKVYYFADDEHKNFGERLETEPVLLEKLNFMPQDILNLREKREFLKKVYLISAITILLSIFAGIYFGVVKYKNSAKNKIFVQQMKELKPEILLLEKMNKNIKIVENFMGSKKSKLAILNNLSSILPQNVYIREYEYDEVQNMVRIKFRTNSYANSSLIISRLGKAKLFKSLENKGSYSVNIGDLKLIDFEVIGVLQND